MMRKTLFCLSVATMALASCSQNELVGDQGSLLQSGNRSMKFGSYVARPTSRATGVDLPAFQKDGNFKSWAYVTTKADGTSDDLATADNIALHTAIFGGKALDGSDLFEYDNTTDPTKPIWKSTLAQNYYWPTDGLGKVSFYALSSTTGAGSESVTTLTAPTKTVGASFAYTVGANGTTLADHKQEDLMGAQMYNKVWDTDEETSKIVLDFKHLLTQVRFAAKASDESYKIKILKLTVTGATNAGTFTFDVSGAKLGAWAIAADATKDDYTYFDATVDGGQVGDFALGFPKDDAADPAKHFIGTTAMDFPLFGTYLADGTAPDKTNALMVLPAEDTKGLMYVKINVTYQCYILSGNVGEDGTDPAHFVTDGTALNRVIELTDAEKWMMNKKVCYVLTLFNSTSGKIVYTPVVSGYEDQNSDSHLKPDTDYVAPAPAPDPVP